MSFTNRFSTPYTVLTQQQVEQIPLFRQKWLDVITSTEPINVEKISTLIRKIYSALNLKTPSSRIILSNPTKMDYIESCLNLDDQKFAELNVKYPRFSKARMEVKDELKSQVRHGTGKDIYHLFYNLLNKDYKINYTNLRKYRIPNFVKDDQKFAELLWEGVYHYISDLNTSSKNRWFDLKDKPNIEFHTTDHILETGRPWLICSDFYNSITNSKTTEINKNVIELYEQSSGYFKLYQNIFVIIERPIYNFIEHFQYHNRDDRLIQTVRCHSDAGAAIEYNDGCKNYIHHGASVNKDVIETDFTNAPLEKIGEMIIVSNQEIRAVIIKKLGERITEFLNYGKIFKFLCEDNYGELYAYKDSSHRYSKRIRAVRVRNSTPEPDGKRKDYLLFVPSDCNTPHEAIAWTFNETKKTYNPLIET